MHEQRANIQIGQAIVNVFPCLSPIDRFQNPFPARGVGNMIRVGSLPIEYSSGDVYNVWVLGVDPDIARQAVSSPDSLPGSASIHSFINYASYFFDPSSLLRFSTIGPAVPFCCCKNDFRCFRMDSNSSKRESLGEFLSDVVGHLIPGIATIGRFENLGRMLTAHPDNIVIMRVNRQAKYGD